MNDLLKNKPLHLPGQSLDEQLNLLINEKIFSSLAIVVLSIVIIINEWIKAYWPVPPRPIATTIIGILIIIYFVYKMIKSFSEAQKIRLGRDGERVVGQELEKLRINGCIVFHDIIGKNFNIDHVVISPQGVFTIETKTWNKRNGKEVIKFDGKSLIINGFKNIDPVIQCIAEANSLKQIIKESTGKEFQVRPVLVFPGWFVDPEGTRLAQKNGIWLLNDKALPAFIKNSAHILNNEDINLISFHLTRYILGTYID